MKLQYRARQRDGKLVTGAVESDTITDARRKLREQGLFVLALAAPGKGGGQGGSSWLSRRRRVKQADLVMIVSQITIMCQSGVDLAEALKNVAQQCPKPALKVVLEGVYQDVASGVSFSAALARHQGTFDETFVAGIAAGEKSGAITEVLERLTQLMRADMRLRSGVWSMLMYPMVLCGVTTVVLSAMVFFVLPTFSKVFVDLGKTPPPLTQLLLSTAQWFRGHSILVVLAVGGLAFAIYRLRSTSAVRQMWDYATLNLAVVRGATRALSTGRAFRLLGTMLQSGVPLLEGIQLCRSAARNRLFCAMFDQLEHEVLQGQGVGKTLLVTTFLPLGAAHMVATAERTGKLATVLQSVGEYYEDEGEKHLRDLVKVLEPAVIIVLGVVVGGVVLSVVLPMLDVSTISH